MLNPIYICRYLHICMHRSIASTLSWTNLFQVWAPWSRGQDLMSGSCTKDAVAIELHMLRHPPWCEVSAEESLELLVLLGMVPPWLCLGETQMEKRGHLKVVSGEAPNTSWIILSNCVAVVYRTNSKPLFLAFKHGTVWSKFTPPALIFTVARHSSVWHSNPTTFCTISYSLPILFYFLI